MFSEGEIAGNADHQHRQRVDRPLQHQGVPEQPVHGGAEPVIPWPMIEKPIGPEHQVGRLKRLERIAVAAKFSGIVYDVNQRLIDGKIGSGIGETEENMRQGSQSAGAHQDGNNINDL